ncbi:MAG TPA: DNA polymerase [Gemmataceae bacterium]|nr:DNA polymerase [Gemmataceae bacterium]
MQAGITLAHWFAYEARRVYGTLSETLEERDTRKLIEFIQARGGRITPRQLMRGNCRKYPSVEVAEAALNALGQARCGVWRNSPTGPQGGRPTRVFELCMTHDTTDTTPDADEDEEGDDNEGPPPPPHDRSPTGPSGGMQITGESGGSVSCVMRHAGEGARASANDGANGQPSSNGTTSDGCVMRSGLVPVVGDSTGILAEQGVAEAGKEWPCADGRCVDLPPDSPQPTPPVAYRLINSADDLPTVAAAIKESRLVGIDLETTGLDARRDRARLLSVAADTIAGEAFAYLVDCFHVDPRPLFGLLAERPLVGHNLQFDLTFLARLGFEPGAVHDTMLLSQLLHGPRKGRGFHSLAQTAERELGQVLSKELQRSDWSGTLSEAQLEYAARDVLVLLPLHDKLACKVADTRQDQAAEIEARCLPAVAWLAGTGVPFDRVAWEALAAEAEREVEELDRQLDAVAPARPGYLTAAAAWNWDSPEQVKEAFAEVGVALESTEDDALAAIDHPLAPLVRQRRAAGKRVSTYGRDWLKHVAADGRVYADWRQLGCITGRMSSSSPNLQNLPGDERYRRCFRAPEGRVLVKADYSQIELRIAARISGDRALLEAYRIGQDVHTLTARRMTGKQDVTPAERKLAKPVNFGLIYGLSAKTLRRKALAEYGVSMSEADAERYKAAFFRTYAGVARWHQQIRREQAAEVRTLAGRRIVVDRAGFYGAKANYAVQGTGGDGLKLALALLWERQHEAPGAFPVLAVHDEIVVECDADQADTVAAWLKRAMVDAMAPLIAPVPVEVEVKVGTTWGGAD